MTAYDAELAIRLARASLDAYAGPTHTERLQKQWKSDSAKLIVAGETEALLLLFPDHAILAFRGTSSAADVRTDIRSGRAIWKGTSVHEGFLTAWLEIRPAIVAALQGHLLDGQPLYVTGHSLGGGLATLCACDFSGGRYAGRTVLYSFGSPRVGDRHFASLCNQRLANRQWRVVHGNDVVPRVPRVFRTSMLLPKYIPLLPTSRRYRHSDSLVLLTEDGHTLLDPSAFRLLVERVIGFRADFGRDHLMVNYLEALL